MDALPHSLKNTTGIFLLYEGLPPTVIESQVLSHVLAMSEAGIQMEVWSFALNQKSYIDACRSLPRLLRDFPITIRVFRGFSPWLPLSDKLNSLLLLWRMTRLGSSPIFVHARTERATAIALMAKKVCCFRLIWDARGDSLSELKVEVQRHYFIWRWLAKFTKQKILSNRLMIAAQGCDGAIFVSTALRNLQGHSIPPERTIVVPCVADEALFYYSPELRAETRLTLNYKNEDQVIIYVGSAAPWQCIPETISFIEQALRADELFKALIVTPDIERFEMAISDDLRARITFISATLREMNSLLNAADFGILFRKKDKINWVASPVKFAEYCLTGLTVLTTMAVEQIIQFGSQIGNIIQVDHFLEQKVKIDDELKSRADIANRARNILGRNAYKKKLQNFYCGLENSDCEPGK